MMPGAKYVVVNQDIEVSQLLINLSFPHIIKLNKLIMKRK